MFISLDFAWHKSGRIDKSERKRSAKSNRNNFFFANLDFNSHISLESDDSVINGLHTSNKHSIALRITIGQGTAVNDVQCVANNCELRKKKETICRSSDVFKLTSNV